jgi:hypothetical protein
MVEDPDNSQVVSTFRLEAVHVLSEYLEEARSAVVDVPKQLGVGWFGTLVNANRINGSPMAHHDLRGSEVARDTTCWMPDPTRLRALVALEATILIYCVRTHAKRTVE